MPEILVKKSGRYALSGVHVVDMKAGSVMDVSQREFDEIANTDWADPVLEVSSGEDDNKPDLIPNGNDKDDNASDVDMTFAEALVEDGDKLALAEYAAGFDVVLDKRKAISGMLVDFKTELASQ